MAVQQRVRDMEIDRDQGRTRAVLMTVFRTLKNRGLDPLPALTDALRTSTATGTLPPLPETVSSEG